MSRIPPRRFAGVLVPLSCVSSRAGLGIGEIPDLQVLCGWAKNCRLSVIQVLPLFEAPPEETSPYAAISSFALDPIYLRLSACREIERSPRARAVMDREDFRREAKRLSSGSRVNHAAVRKLKRRVTDAAFEDHASGLTRTPERELAFESFRRREHSWLADHARYLALWRRHGIDWRLWPAPLRNRDPLALAEVDRAESAEILKASFLQWLLDEQWSAVRAHAVTAGIRLKGDIPFGIAAASVDAWVEQECFDFERTVGAPPDAFNEEGQDWGLPAPRWEVMREGGYSWWRRRARRAANLFDAFRVDHVIGLFRTYTIGRDANRRDRRFSPATDEEQLAQGCALLDILLAETGHDGVFAEDLGRVPSFLPAELRARGIPGYKVVRWEREPGTDRLADPSSYPEDSVAITGTHDTTSLSAWWKDELSDDQRSWVLAKASASIEEHAKVPATLTARVHRSILAWVLGAGSVGAIIPIQDVFLWRQRFNTPGTIGPHNWSWRMPVRVEHLGFERRTAGASQTLGELVAASGRAPDQGRP
jgi:4-alpha-glucanotransferase